MKARKYGLSAALLALVMFVPAALGAQQTPPVPPTPPAPPVWIAQTPQHVLVRTDNGLAQALEVLPAEEGWLGVGVSEVSAAQARQAKLPRLEGVYVESVEPDSPAAKAGVQPHDIIVEYNGTAVEGVLQFRRLVRETPPGRSASLRVWRGGREQTLSAKVTSRRSLLESRMKGLRNRLKNIRVYVTTSPFAHPLLGVRVEEVSGQLGGYFQVPGGRGVLVTSVTAGSAAEKAGVKAGDVIYQVEGKSVHTAGELEEALRKNCSASGVSLGIVRKGVTLQLTAPIKCPQPAVPEGAASKTR